MFIPPGEKIVDTKKCRISGQEFFVTDRDLEFYDKISPIFEGKKYSIPSPTLCPDERKINILCFRNDRHLYKNKSSLSGQDIIAVFREDSPFTIYTPEEWYGDTWSPANFAQNVDFNDNIFSQIHSLSWRVPHMNLIQRSNENSEYANEWRNNTSCYLIFNWSENIQSYYSSYCDRNRNIFDCTYIKDCELCYECVNVKNCYNVSHSINVDFCTHSQYIADCLSCEYCFWCVNLATKKCYILNQKVSQEQYADFLHHFTTDTEAQRDFFQRFQTLKLSLLSRSMQGNSNEQVFWEYIYHSKDVFLGFDILESQHVRYSDLVERSHDIYDCFRSRYSEYCYFNEVASTGASHVAFNLISIGCINTLYSQQVYNTHDCFACIWLHNHEHHCILNKSYSTQEYETLCGKIIDHMRSTGEWGEFFPHELSPFWYNETVANEYFPMTESEVQVKGWNWYAEPTAIFSGTSYIPLPIREYDERVVWNTLAQKNIDEVLAGIIQCEVTGKPFKIIKQELAFYIENSIPIPVKHPDQRHKERMNLRNPRTLFERTCAECYKDIITTYAPKRLEKVVCEECYRKLVY